MEVGKAEAQSFFTVIFDYNLEIRGMVLSLLWRGPDNKHGFFLHAYNDDIRLVNQQPCSSFPCVG